MSMTHLLSSIRTFLSASLGDSPRGLVRDERGAAAIEYGLIAALIAVAAIQAMSAVGTALGSTFNEVNSAIGGDAPEDQGQPTDQGQPFESPPSGQNFE